MSDTDATSGSRPAKGSPTPRRDHENPERTGPVTFYRQVMAELRKVVWPTQQQLITYFVVTMVFVVVIMALVAALDLGFGELMFWMFANEG